MPLGGPGKGAGGGGLDWRMPTTGSSQPPPIPDYSEVSPIVLHAAYSQESVHSAHLLRSNLFGLHANDPQESMHPVWRSTQK